jgi:hypothetical protein
MLKHWSQLLVEPVTEGRTTSGISRQLDTEADFGERHRADIQVIEQLPSQESDDPGLRFRPTQF